MRSRYTAYVMGDERYLLATWHPSTRPSEVRAEPGTRWLGLEVRDHRELDAEHAEVEFVARYRIGGRGARLHERSRFVREDGRWYYVDVSSGTSLGGQLCCPPISRWGQWWATSCPPYEDRDVAMTEFRE